MPRILFYPRPPRGGRLQSFSTPRPLLSFLPTPSARRATSSCKSSLSVHSYFYPRPPRGGRLRRAGLARPPADFYPRPPRGGRPRRLPPTARSSPFLPTPSARRATQPPTAPGISVEFLPTPSARRATSPTARAKPSWINFYPRPPRGGRPGGLVLGGNYDSDFYPRPPRGGRHCQQSRNAPGG